MNFLKFRPRISGLWSWAAKPRPLRQPRFHSTRGPTHTVTHKLNELSFSNIRASLGTIRRYVFDKEDCDVRVTEVDVRVAAELLDTEIQELMARAERLAQEVATLDLKYEALGGYDTIRQKLTKRLKGG